MAELVARRYAEALFEVALENNQKDSIKEELQFIGDCLKENSQFFQLLRSPLITLKEKKKIMTHIFKGRVSQEVMNFLFIILDKKREKHIEEMIEIYQKLVDESENIVEAVVMTAVPMSQKDLLTLQSKLSMASGMNVQLKNEVKQDLLGGVLIKMGDKIIDDTIKNRLDRMREQLLQIIV